MLGRKRRFERFRYRDSRKGLIVPIDHGLTLGPLPGIECVREIAQWIRHEAICGVIAHKGLAERLLEARLLERKGLMVHLNGTSVLSERPDDKVRLTSIESALRLGADAISFQVNFTGGNDSANLELMGHIVDEAQRFALPVLAMIYDKVKSDEAQAASRQRHLIRMAIEMGCDAVKIGAPTDVRVLPAWLNSLSEDIPIYLAGGSITDETQLFELTHAALAAGASGLCVGRNVFQRSNCGELLSQLRDILDPVPHLQGGVKYARGVSYGAH